MNMPHPSATPGSVLLVRPDTLGDIVLFSAALRALRHAMPGMRLGIVLRSAYADLMPLLAPGVDCITTGIDPFRMSPSQAEREAQELAQRVRDWNADWLVAACPKRTWLDFFLAATVRAPRQSAFASTDPDPYFYGQLLRILPEAASSIFTETAPDASGTSSEWKRGLALASWICGKPIGEESPRLDLPEDLSIRADAVLASIGLAPGAYAVCAAAGFANVRIKTWPAERFGACIAHLEAKHGVPTLLIGQSDEGTHLEAVAAAAAPAHPSFWIGGPRDLPLLAALLARSRLFLGNDTGAMHLAAAADIPIVAVFGGGTWPRFLPAGRRSVAVAQLLPCYGCGWDCPWGDAPCLKAIAPEPVKEVIDEIFAAGASSFQIVRKVEAIPQSTADFLGKGAEIARTRAADHLSRLLKLEEIAALAAEKDGEIVALKTAADEKQLEIDALKAETDHKDLEIVSLKRDTEQKLGELLLKDDEIRLLKEAANAKDVEIRNLKQTAELRRAEGDAKQEEIVLLKRACDERLELLNRIETTCRALASERESLLTALEAARSSESQAKEQASATEALYRRLDPDASKWASQLADIHARHEALGVELKTRLAEIDALRTQLAEKELSLQNYFNQLGALEVNKHYQRLLREKEDVVQMLHRACQERESVIRRLVAEATAGTAGLRRLALGISSWWEARVSQPCREWSRTRILDGYWMQLGGLYQYAPRPVSWDKSVLGARRVAGSAPRIGLVTPSFNQAVFLERTLRSVLDQKYPNIKYVIQDGGSRDDSPAIIRAASPRLHAWECAPDKGQADAIRKGFAKLSGELGRDDIMAWLNSDDLLAPGSLHWVGRFFTAHPDVDVLYGHRIIVDEDDREVGRWVLPPHNPETLRWIDFIPQETMFWRVRAWDNVGGLDPSFHFALDWDLALRFQEAGLKIVRVPRFLGVFRVHSQQKTSAQIHTRGQEEMDRVRRRLHGPTPDTSRLDHETRKAQLSGALCSRLLDLGIRY